MTRLARHPPSVTPTGDILEPRFSAVLINLLGDSVGHWTITVDTTQKHSNGRTITRENLKAAINAAREAAHAASIAGEGAAVAAEAALNVMDAEDKASVRAKHQAREARPADRKPIQAFVERRKPPATRAEQPTGGEQKGMPDNPKMSDPQAEHRLAYEEFIAKLEPIIRNLGSKVTMTPNKSFIKFESRVNGHRLYISKGKTAVGRVECTLPPGSVDGATEPDRPNGRIASWLPVNHEVVGAALEKLGDEAEPPMPTARSRGNNNE